MSTPTTPKFPVRDFSKVTEAEAVVWAHEDPDASYLRTVVVRKNGKVSCSNGCRWSVKPGDRLVCITRNGVDMKPINTIINGVAKVVYVPVD